VPTGQRKPTEDRREVSIHLRLTSAQKAAIERAARQATLDPSTWVRMTALAATDWKPEKDSG
jgi:uncharacterized protein (DUF1778 family)